MDEADSTGNAPGPSEDLSSGWDPVQRLRERLAEVVRVLVLADEEGRRAGPAAFRLLEKYRTPLAEAAYQLGEVLPDFRSADGSSPPLFENPVFLEQIGPLYGYLRSLPLFRRVQDWSQNVWDSGEVERTMLQANQPGYDLPTRLVADFYRRTEMVRSFQSRAAAMGEWVRVEVRMRAISTKKPVRLLRLLCGSGLEVEVVLADPVCAQNMMVLCVDQNLPALRRGREELGKRLAHKPRFLRADPLALGLHLNRPRQRFDVIYTLTLFDNLSDSEALKMLRICYDLLAPEGVLLTGGYLPELPRSEMALLAGLMEAHLYYRDEAEWRRMLRGAAFDLGNSRLEQRLPAAILVAARRSGNAQK